MAGRVIYPLVLLLLLAATSFGQTQADVRLPSSDWRQIGGTTFEASLAELASGPVEEVWYSPDGATLYGRTGSGRLFETSDFELWRPSAAVDRPDEALAPGDANLPEAGAVVKGLSATRYALGRAVHRSDDGGLTWNNLTEYRRRSIIGEGLTDLAISPRDNQEITVAGQFGVWRSVDGGLSWSGLNQSLPNLPALRLLGLPGGGRGTRILAAAGALEWAPGEKSAWQPVESTERSQESDLRDRVAQILEAPVVTVITAEDYVYAGGALRGRLWVSPDRGVSWRSFEMDDDATITRIFPIPGDPRVALAAAVSDDGPHILRTTNGGIFWDDLTGSLDGSQSNSVVADPATGSVYAATDKGVFLSIVDLLGAGSATPWVRVSEGLPDVPVYDLRLDDGGNQLYVLLEGEGVYAGTAPHRFLAPSVVNAADLRARGASPGVLLSVLGGNVTSAGAGPLTVPILAAAARESQIQVPFEISGSALSLALITATPSGETRWITLGMPLFEADPAIFVDRDGTPMVLDADSGVLLDAMTPAHSSSRIQILATGLGKVDPAWPTGLAAPLDDPPAVVAAITIMLDRTAIEATRATLAPGYVGFYLVEFIVPDIVNSGPAELYIEAAGRLSNRTRIYLEQ
jgi:uncharacterized protein (TIGR03437 family)